ncbi:uroporphyrinogen-III C-methyltransferase [Leptospira perolatii]|uniref:uroporphyrinogen-III C-methyltransferase n=1 Tax=Leptospira perolatii TaxID=2023191 RepID=A0A2M9ZRJ3_9LEPT|nr:uroporphyrinogen-III C-methyltransferase [Leptospira perolatii]PJZ71164.1 uroporphyrinogen-III C-methyltransferase [Leptospira perolatii]PJZ74697.1 uroporphyrinogen-III C-methyltransferase [Leptospira perolatii]
MESKGKVYLVGAGPGNPDLLTVRGLRILQSAEVILYDALLDPGFLELFPENAIAHYVGKRAGQHSATQEEIHELLISYAIQGKTVVRLKGGDPFLFGRGGEEVIALRKKNIPYEIVPGLSSLTGGSSGSGIPLTHRGISRQVLIMDGHTVLLEDTDWEWYAKFKGTIVLFMGTSSIQRIAVHLIENGAPFDLPVALVENASLSNQSVQISSLKKVASQGLAKITKGPGIIYIGAVVRLYPQVNLLNEEQIQSPDELIREIEGLVDWKNFQGILG